MISEATVESIPLQTDADGVIRVAGTRVPLETVIRVFEAGATPEEIAQNFDILHLDDIYAVITYYLRHRAEVEAYLQERETLAEKMRREVEARFPQADLRRRLLARCG